MARPPMFFDDKEKAAIVADALEALSNGVTLRAFVIERSLNYSTVWSWLNPDGGDNSPYARARNIGTHALVDECIEIADDANPETASVAKVKIDTRLRIVGKWNQGDYGDKSQVDLTTKGERLRDEITDADAAKIAAKMKQLDDEV